MRKSVVSLVLAPFTPKAVQQCRKRMFFSYYFQLEETAKERYRAKLDRIGPNTDDPYTFTSGTRITDAMPAIEYPDIYLQLLDRYT